MFEDLKSSEFHPKDLEDQTNFLEMTANENCCIIKNEKSQGASRPREVYTLFHFDMQIRQ